MTPKILVTPRSVTAGGHPSLARLEAAGYEVALSAAGRQPTEQELPGLLQGCVGYLAGVEPISGATLETAKDLKVIARNGVGLNNVDLAAAERLGIVVRPAVGANARGVAELAVAHLLSLARWVPWSDARIKAGGWERRKGIELLGRTLGIVGCGAVGRIVAKLALGFDMKILAFDVKPDVAFAPSADFRFAPLAEVLEHSDFVSLHCPAPPGGKPLIDGAALARMKKGVLIVNTARADLVDRAALSAALKCGQVAGAALDVFETEPPAGDPLVVEDRVVATPHLGGFTDESVDRAVAAAVDNLLEELPRLGD